MTGLGKIRMHYSLQPSQTPFYVKIQRVWVEIEWLGEIDLRMIDEYIDGL
jgi:hypothetical protein